MTSFLAALVLAPPAAALRPSPPASAIIAAAETRASRERKNVLVLFKASWCPWCKRFDMLIADPALAPAWQRSYVVARVHMRERGKLKRLENPGWEGLMKRFRGTNAVDVPYMAILNPSGRKIADSMPPINGKIPDNAAYPSTGPEITAFVGSIARTSKFRSNELAALRSRIPVVSRKVKTAPRRSKAPAALAASPRPRG